ncbi:hypothetical protein GCM10009610_18460 [Pseudonocardia xinjiangensis]
MAAGTVIRRCGRRHRRAHGRERPVPPDPHRPPVGFRLRPRRIDDHTRLAYAEIHPDEKAHRGHPLISRVKNPPGHYI